MFTLLCFTAADWCNTRDERGLWDWHAITITSTFELLIDPRATRAILKSQHEIWKQEQRGFMEKGEKHEFMEQSGRKLVENFSF